MSLNFGVANSPTMFHISPNHAIHIREGLIHFFPANPLGPENLSYAQLCEFRDWVVDRVNALRPQTKLASFYYPADMPLELAKTDPSRCANHVKVNCGIAKGMRDCSCSFSIPVDQLRYIASGEIHESF